MNILSVRVSPIIIIFLIRNFREKKFSGIAKFLIFRGNLLSQIDRIETLCWNLSARACCKSQF